MVGVDSDNGLDAESVGDGRGESRAGLVLRMRFGNAESARIKEGRGERRAESTHAGLVNEKK